ncbi:G protein-coupled receptor gpr1 [Cladophialophora chaetospira]|uniref:G protein-coupled receptor gpr1 n=1 Tax=Cladophialophora chaetospira TaxID=386627 RepID=A0AA39CMK8_9EURO|nr:G protein-coupled receptor gpr1 [Cladophialophora chaetospira]
MRKCFRHRLVLHLIISDTMKAIWYFIFPIVVFARGSVASASKFCQASGFLLSFAIEASDMAILIIALHCTLCILRPQNAVGEGGLHRYRNWIYPFWLVPPLIAASLAFVNNQEAYVTAGTFCYLPKRPFWYRLALSWVPRYVIICVILTMYLSIYIYVHIKFRGFDNLGATDPAYDTEVRRRSAFSARSEKADRRGTDTSNRPARSSALSSSHWQAKYQISQTSPELQPWDNMHFVTTKPLEVSRSEPARENEVRDMEARGSGWSGDTQVLPTNRLGQPMQSDAARLKHEDSPNGSASGSHSCEQPEEATHSLMKKSGKAADSLEDPLKKTRRAIRKQLRYLFIYPLVYIVMWSLPFASHALNYSDYYVQHPVFWLSLVSTIMLSLQAGADSVMFSCSEKPWRRVDASSKFSVPSLHRRSKNLLQRRSIEKGPGSTTEPSAPSHPVKDQNPTWWEAEGRKRNDSVWLGTVSNAFSSLTTRTRSRSPQKRKQNMHSRARSSEQGSAFVPRLEPIIPASPGSTMP